jgi:hypothetical protein
MAKLISTTQTTEVNVMDPQEAQALATMLRKYGIKVIVTK